MDILSLAPILLMVVAVYVLLIRPKRGKNVTRRLESPKFKLGTMPTC